MEKRERIIFEMVKTKSYNLRPYGNYQLKWCPKRNLPHIIPVNEIRVIDGSRMPIDKNKEVDDEIIRFMKEHKTDVLVDDHGNFYTRYGDFVQIYHEKLKVEYFKTK